MTLPGREHQERKIAPADLVFEAWLRPARVGVEIRKMC
jgi:hypothetical protein